MNIAKSDIRILKSLVGNPSDDVIRYAIETVRSKYPNDPEVAAYIARNLAESGEVLSASGDLVGDVASTGGPSSLSTIISPLFLRASGAVVPKLGVPGRPAGGIDSLAQIPNYRTTLLAREVYRVLGESGYAHFLAGGEFAPRDGKMFRLRQETGAQAVPGLVAASLLAKKLAVGVKYAGLDVRVSSYANFGTDWASAEENARMFVKTAMLLGIEASPVLTDAKYPYQPYLGRSESLVALDDFFDGRASSWLEDHCMTCRTLALACIPEEYRARVVHVSFDDLRSHFNQNLLAQGADPEGFKAVVQSTRRDHQIEITADHAGFCYYSVQNIRDVMVRWQKQYVSEKGHFPDPIGLIFLHRPGTWVEKGEPLATLRAPKKRVAEALAQLNPWVANPTAGPLAPGVERIYG
ncbi:MAG: hypothetical protein ABW090_16025 [Sedimenticola sp.]